MLTIGNLAPDADGPPKATNYPDPNLPAAVTTSKKAYQIFEDKEKRNSDQSDIIMKILLYFAGKIIHLKVDSKKILAQKAKLTY